MAATTPVIDMWTEHRSDRFQLLGGFRRYRQALVPSNRPFPACMDPNRGRDDPVTANLSDWAHPTLSSALFRPISSRSAKSSPHWVARLALVGIGLAALVIARPRIV